MITHEPANVEEAAAVMALGERITFIGGGSQGGASRFSAPIDAEIRTRHMARILDYAPADMVLTAEAGVTVSQIQNAAREHGQMLALDPPNPGRSTIAGVVATGAFGPRRARYGTVRDLIIGVTLIRPDGVIARGGGKVVKNVAGFDLPKVACGSFGTLAMIATATFRLHPLPEMSRTVVCKQLRPDDVVAKIASVRQKQLEPTSVVAMRNSDGTYDVAFRFEGFGKGVLQQIERIECDANAGDFWQRHDACRAGPFRLRIASLPTRLPVVDRVIAPILDAISVAPRPSAASAAEGGGATRNASFAWYATLGLGFVSGVWSDASIAAINAARSELVASGGSLVVESAPDDIGIDPWGPVGPSLPLMQQLKSRFDPDRRLKPGRFAGGL